MGCLVQTHVPNDTAVVRKGLTTKVLEPRMWVQGAYVQQ